MSLRAAKGFDLETFKAIVKTMQIKFYDDRGLICEAYIPIKEYFRTPIFAFVLTDGR